MLIAGGGLLVVDKLLELDRILEQIAILRRDAAHADNVLLADQLDIQWREYDEIRQQATATATDRYLIAYEVERHRLKSGYA
jgi:hypothetical protein